MVKQKLENTNVQPLRGRGQNYFKDGKDMKSIWPARILLQVLFIFVIALMSPSAARAATENLNCSIEVDDSGILFDEEDGGSTDSDTLNVSNVAAGQTITIFYDSDSNGNKRAITSRTSGTATGSPVLPNDSGSALNGNGTSKVHTIVLSNFGGTGAASFNLQLTNDNNSSQDARITWKATCSTPARTVSIQNTTNATEAGTPGVFTVTPSTTSTSDTVVNYTVTGTATGSGVDFTLASGAVTIPANATSAPISFTAVNDNLADSGETVVVTLTSANNATTIGNPASATNTIQDNGTANVAIIFRNLVATEGGTNGSFKINLTSQPTGNVTTAITGDGQCTFLPASVTHTPANWNEALPSGGNIVITAVDDSAVEGPHTCTPTFTVTSTDSFYNGKTPSPAPITVVVTDNDSAKLSVTSAPNAAEQNTPGKFTISLDKPVPTPTIVTFTLAGAAFEGTDYDAITKTVTIDPNTTSKEITVNPKPDNLVEGPETVELTLATEDNALVDIDTAKNKATNTIGDDDEANVVLSAAADGSEVGPVHGSFTVALNGGKKLVNPLTVYYEITVAGGDATQGDDYESLTGSVVIPANIDDASESIAITVLPDGLVEGTEYVELSLKSGEGYKIVASGADRKRKISIADGDKVKVTVTADDAAKEDATNGTFTIKLSEPAPSTVTVAYGLSGVAQEGTDYEAIATKTVTFEVGDEAKIVTIDVKPDDLVETGGETVKLILGEVTGPAAVDTPADATLTIADDDEAGYSVSKTSVTVSEDEVTTATFTVVLKKQPTGSVVFSVTSGDTEEATVSHATLTFDGEDWSIPKTVTVTGVNDDLVDGPQTANTTISVIAESSDDAFDGLANETVAVTTEDNDFAEPGITFEIDDKSASEDNVDDTAGGELKLNSEPQGDVIVRATTNGQCTISPSSFTFTSDETENYWDDSQLFKITAVNDDIPEEKQVCVVTFDASSEDDENYNGMSTPVTFTITEDGGGELGTGGEPEQFQSASRKFMSNRLNMIAGNEPVLYRLSKRGKGGVGSNTIEVTGENGNVEGNFAVSSHGVMSALDRRKATIVATADLPNAEELVSDWNLWSEGQFGFFQNKGGAVDTKGDFFVGYLGLDYRVGENTVLGFMGEVDWMESREQGSINEIDGNGFLVGPYISSEIASNIFFDARALWGLSDNDAIQDVAGTTYTGDFQTERILLEAKLAGQHDMENLRLTPELAVLYTADDQSAYTISDGLGGTVAVPGQTVELGRASAGLTLTHLGQMGGYSFEPFIGGKLNWDFENPDATSNDLKAALSAGFNLKSDDLQFGAQATWDGVGSSGYEGISGKLTFGHAF